jgi:hypothetical protein
MFHVKHKRRQIMNRAEQILYSALEEAIKKYGEGNVPRET